MRSAPEIESGSFTQARSCAVSGGRSTGSTDAAGSADGGTKVTDPAGLGMTADPTDATLP
jgi:hypothetical protein